MSKTHVSEFTSFLYAIPSFLEGLARIIDFGNALQEYNTSSTPELADERAIRADWQAVGDDLYKVVAERDSIPYQAVFLSDEGITEADEIRAWELINQYGWDV